MLVLTRRVGEAIVIAGGISVTILQNHSGRVQLGIEAPREVTVLRREVYDRKSPRSPAGAPKAASQQS